MENFFDFCIFSRICKTFSAFLEVRVHRIRHIRHKQTPRLCALIPVQGWEAGWINAFLSVFWKLLTDSQFFLLSWEMLLVCFPIKTFCPWENKSGSLTVLKKLSQPGDDHLSEQFCLSNRPVLSTRMCPHRAPSGPHRVPRHRLRPCSRLRRWHARPKRRGPCRPPRRARSRRRWRAAPAGQEIGRASCRERV